MQKQNTKSNPKKYGNDGYIKYKDSDGFKDKANKNLKENPKFKITVKSAAEPEVYGYVVRRVMPRGDTERVFGLARGRKEVGFSWIASLKGATWYDTRKDAEDAALLAKQILKVRERLEVVAVRVSDPTEVA